MSSGPGSLRAGCSGYAKVGCCCCGYAGSGCCCGGYSGGGSCCCGGGGGAGSSCCANATDPVNARHVIAAMSLLMNTSRQRKCHEQAPDHLSACDKLHTYVLENGDVPDRNVRRGEFSTVQRMAES